MDFTQDMGTAMRHFAKSGGFLTVKDGGKVNTMTISWGFIGFIWGKPHFITVVRPQRFTKPMLDTAQAFTVSIPYGTMAEALRVCGTQSGRDIDKSAIVSFGTAQAVDGCYVEGCDRVYECRVVCQDEMREDALPAEIRKFYTDKDYHTVYIGEIVACYGREQ